MSVAFRRESDEEHLEPKFERPIPSGPNLVTPRGLSLIVEQIAEHEAQVRCVADEAARAGLQRDLRYWQTVLFPPMSDICDGKAYLKPQTTRFGPTFRPTFQDSFV